MNEMENAHLLLTFARDFFRGSLKSSNKTYSEYYGNATSSRKQRRIENCDKAGYAIGALRTHEHASQEMKSLLATNREQRAGNCNEYATIALRQGVGLKIPNIWFAENDMHAFIMLAEDLPSSMILNDFHYHVDSNSWVCDPWCNVICEMHTFPMMITAKAGKWEMEGKEIYSGNDTLPALATHWTQRLLRTKIYFDRMTDNTGRPTDFYKKYYTLSWTTKILRWWRSR